MASTININGLTLVHKESDGVAKATLPNLCLPPNGSTPINFSNVAYSKDIAKGTITITADGVNMCAHKDSEFSKSTGDEGGTNGEIFSGTNMAEATWLTYSPDVFLEGKNACRLTDKMFMNHMNSACLSGEGQPPLTISQKMYKKFLCKIVCECDKMPAKGPKGTDLKQECVKKSWMHWIPHQEKAI